MIIDMDTPYIHGITIFNKDGQPMGRVQSIDTDTLVCKIKEGGVEREETAAGFVNVFVGEKSYRRAMEYFPEDVSRFFYLHEDQDTIQEAYKQHIAEILGQ